MSAPSTAARSENTAPDSVPPRPTSASTTATANLPTRYDTRASPFLDLGMPFTVYEAVKLFAFAPLLLLRCTIAVTACCVLACFSWAASAGQ